MKKLLLFISIFNFLISYSQNNVIEEVNKLIENKKYSSAMKLLNEADPNNQNPELVIAKTDLLLNYFAKSIMHKFFGLKDLEPNEDLMKLRESEGEFDIVTFDPDSIIKKLIIKYPDNYQLRKTLGNYFHEVHLKYPEGWFDPDSIIIQKIIENYKVAYDHGIYDYWSLYGIGYCYLFQGKYNESIPYFEESIKLKSDYPSSYYNLAYAFLYNNQREESIENAIKAFELYDYPAYKADAARMIAVTYRELAQNDKAIDYYLKADAIQPNDYYTLKPLLDLEIMTEKDSYKTRTNEFFMLAPDNPTIYQDLIQIYWNNKKQDELLEFFENQKSNFKSDDKVLGNLYFYIAIVYYNKKDYQNSKSNFEKSRNIFKKVYQPNHKVFEVIDSYINNM